MTQGFGRRVLDGVPGFHHGIDLACALGQPIYPADAGREVFNGVMPDYGNVIVIQNSRRVRTLYAHMSVRYKRAGARVKRDTMIGRCGSTGHSTGPHLHFEVYYNLLARNPLGFLPRRGR